jgi:4-aminobutyrate aminotransferase-like enzyme
MAKPLANGYPIGAVLLRDTIASTMTPGKIPRTTIVGVTVQWELTATARHSWDNVWRVTHGLCSRTSRPEPP